MRERSVKRVLARTKYAPSNFISLSMRIYPTVFSLSHARTHTYYTRFLSLSFSLSCDISNERGQHVRDCERSFAVTTFDHSKIFHSNLGVAFITLIVVRPIQFANKSFIFYLSQRATKGKRKKSNCPQ